MGPNDSQLQLGSSFKDTGFLSLPARYGIDVNEKVQFTTTNNDESLGAGAGAATILVAKICDTLINHSNDNGDYGYDEETVCKVGRLVVKNTLTIESTQVDSIDDLGKEDVRTDQTVATMLNGLFDHKVSRARSVHFNSNEPVLLVNGNNDISSTDLIRAIDAATTQLQQDHYIWPVRVYGGRFWPVKGTGFSISVLNVVNTDIGGPSMVQLLDAHCDAPEWNAFLRRDVWRDRDLVSREQAHGGFGHEQQIHDDYDGDDRSEHSVHSEGSMSTDQEDYPHDTGPLADLQEVSEKSEPAIKPLDDDQDNVPVATMAEAVPALETLPDESEEVFVSDPVEAEDDISVPEQSDMPERTIDYPTWDRRHDSVSLIDLIRSQALDSSPLELEESVVEAEPDEAATEKSLPPGSGSKDNDDFVVI